MSIDAIPLAGELLLEIFWRTCFRDSSIRTRWPSSTEYRDMLEALLTITAVSSRWRKIALSSGSLWSHVSSHPHEETLKRDVELLRMHVDRSLNAPLHIELFTSQLNHQSARRIAAIVEPTLPRWQTASLWRYSQQPAVFASSFSDLAKLSINSLRPRDAPLFHGASNSPCPLRELNVIGFDPVALLPIPCSSLEVVRLQANYSMAVVPWGVVSQFLSRCLSCVTLTVDFPIATISDAPPSTITLPLFKTLVVSTENYTRIFNLPRLRVLMCVGEAVSAPGPRTMFPSLGYVTLVAPPDVLDDILMPWRISEVYDHARTLDLGGGGKRVGTVLPLLSLLETSSRQPTLFPELEKLIICDCRSQECEGDGFTRSLVEVMTARPSITLECDPVQITALDRIIGGSGSREKYGLRLVEHLEPE